VEILVAGEVRIKILVSLEVPDQDADTEDTDHNESDDGPSWEAFLGNRIGDRSGVIVDVLASEV
jgi:hypothetical protein